MKKIYKSPSNRYRIPTLFFLLLLVQTAARAQFTCGLASSQEGAVAGGVCIACSISNAANAADGDTTSFSTINKTIGAVGYYGQLLRFPGTFQAGDSVSLILEVPGEQLLTANVLGGIRVESFNGVTAGNDAITLTPQLASVQLLGGTTSRYRVTFAVSRPFDGISVSIAGAVSLFSSLRIYAARAFVRPPVIASTAVIHATTETSPVISGICALCGVSNADGAVDGDTTTYSTITASVGAIGYIGQLLRFNGNFSAGDSIRLILQYPGQLADVQALAGIRIETYTNDNPNGSPVFISNLVRISLLGTGGKFMAVIAANHSFNAVSVSINGTASALTSLRVYDAALVFTSQASYQVCEGSSVTMQASLPSNATINWYTTASGGTPVATGTVFTTPPLTGTTTYYAEAGRGGCFNPQRTRVTITASPVPAVPTVVPPSQIACVGDTFSIVASSPQAVVFNWYTQPSGGSAVFTGDTLRLPATQPATYYAAAISNGCASVSRAAAVVNTSVAPSAVTVVPPSATIPAGGTASFTASSSDASAVYNWYTQAAGGAAVYTGAQFTTPALNSNTNYYLSAASAAGCAALSRAQVTVTVNNAADNVPCDAASSQTPAVNGICVGCGVSSPALAADTDSTTASSLFVTAGVTGASAEQVLAFPFTGSAGDTVRVGLHFNSSLADVGLLSSFSIASYNGTTYNNDRTAIAGNTVSVRLLNGGSDAVVSLVPQSVFDRVELRLNGGLAGVLTQLGIRYAVRIKPLATISPAAPVTCAGQAVSLSASGNAGTSFRWYDAPVGGTLLFTGPAYTSPVLSATTSYYVAGVSNTGCENAPRKMVTVTVGAAPAAPAVNTTELNLCSGNTANLSIASPDPQLTYRWYTVASGGTPVGTGTTFTSGAISSDTAFYAEAVSSGGCASTTRTKITVKANAVPAAPQAVANNTSICENASAVLSIQDPVAGITYDWYAAASGGASLASGTSFTTPTLSSTTTYYAGATNSGGCSSARTGVTVTVNPRPASPAVTVTPGSATIAAGSTATISVTAPVAGVTYRWYSSASGGNLLSAGSSFTTPALATTTTYYVEAVSAQGCTSSTRTAVTITVQPVTDLTCDAPVTNSSSVNGVCIGCNVTNGGFATDTDTTTFSQLNMTVGVLGAQVQQTLVFPQTSQAGDSLTLSFEIPPALVSADVLGSIEIETANGGVSNNDAVTLGNTSVRILSGGNRFSIRYSPAALFDRVTVRLNGGVVAALGFLRIYYGTRQVTPPVAVNPVVNVCAGNTANVAVQPRVGITINWYASPSGGVSLGTGNTFTTPVINANTVFYAEATRASNGCTNPVRVPVTVNVDAAPGVPAVVDNAVTVCAGSSASFAVQNTQPGITYRWYDAASGGNLLFTGSTYTTPAMTTNSQFFVEAVNATGCASASRTQAGVTVTSLPAAPAVTGNTVCQGTPTTFTIANNAGGITYNWYRNATGGTPAASGTSFTTPVLQATTTYYTEAVNNGCANSGGRVPVTATVVNNPAAPAVTVSSAAVCNGSNAVVTVQNPDAGLTYQWYTVSSGGSPVFSGPSFTSPPVTVPVTYYVETQATGGCASATRTAVALTVVQPPAAPVAQGGNPVSICTGGSVVLRVQTIGGGVVYEWYDAASGGNFLFTGDQFQTPAVTGNVTFYVQAVSPEGCRSVRTPVAITVNPVPVLPVVTPASVTVVSGGNAAFSINNPAAGTTYNWYDVPVGGTPIATGTSYNASATANDTLYVEAVNASLCASVTRQPVFIAVVQTPQPPQVIGSATAICAGSTAMLSISNPQPGTSYNWYGVLTGGTILYSGTAITTAALSVTTSYYVEAVAGGIASARTQVTVPVTQRPLPPQLSRSADTTCDGTTATINIQSPSTLLQYTWYDAGSGGNQVGTGSAFVTPVISSPSSYFVEASATGCVSATRTRIDIFPDARPGAPAVVNNNLQACEGSVANAEIISPGNNIYRWYDAATGGNLLATGASASINVGLGNRTVYAQTVTTRGCTSASRTAVALTGTNRPAAPVVIVPNTASCRNEQVTLSVQSPDPALTYLWYAFLSDEAPDHTGTSMTISPATDTTYYVAARNTIGCISDRTPAGVNVIEALPSPVTMPPTSSANAVTFTWSPVAGANGYEVSLDNGLTFIPVSGTSYTVSGLEPADSVTIWVRSTGTVTCQTSVTATRVTATALNPMGDDVFIPTGFTPNGDGNNDRFRPFGNTISKAEMWVYSQWGALLFRSQDAVQGWDGTAGGKLQPAGVYVYFMRITFRNGITVDKKGSVNLIR